MADDPEWVRLAYELLAGFHEFDANGLPGERRYVAEEDEERYRHALAMLLTSNKPLPPPIGRVLASLIAPDNAELASERRLDFRFRNQARTHPVSGWTPANAFRDQVLAEKVEQAYATEGSVDRAAAVVSETHGLSVATIKRAWNRFAWRRKPEPPKII